MVGSYYRTSLSIRRPKYREDHTVHTEQLFFHPDFNGSNLDQIFTTEQELQNYMNATPSSSSLSFTSLSSPPTSMYFSFPYMWSIELFFVDY